MQVYLHKGGGLATSSAGMLLAVGGRYDHLVQEHWTNTMVLLNFTVYALSFGGGTVLRFPKLLPSGKTRALIIVIL